MRHSSWSCVLLLCICAETLAQDPGKRLLAAFDSPTGLPYQYVNLKTGAVRGTESNPAETGL